jgi:hypothetical protein
MTMQASHVLKLCSSEKCYDDPSGGCLDESEGYG